jgi:hypothetical protein
MKKKMDGVEDGRSTWKNLYAENGAERETELGKILRRGASAN